MKEATPSTQSTRRDLVSRGLGTGLALGLSSQLVAIEEVGAQEARPGGGVSEQERGMRLQRLRQALGEKPVVMLNLMKLKEGASIAPYAEAFDGPSQQHAPGTRLIFVGQCRELLLGEQEWDIVALVEYPSVDKFLAMAGSPEYAEISHLRTDVLEHAVLYALTPTELTA